MSYKELLQDYHKDNIRFGFIPLGPVTNMSQDKLHAMILKSIADNKKKKKKKNQLKKVIKGTTWKNGKWS